ncbi:MAG TPA: uroporphyrinogen-III synthase [Myxococcales bacterium]|nr:uroporphyrinogen-III synthase [Myxococcales bacterium]
MSQRLAGAHALVTRPRERAQELCFLLEDEGARVTALPLLELAPPADPRPLRAAAERLGRFDWVAFSSPSGVAALVDAAREAGTFPQLRRARLAAVGPRTARALKAHGLQVERGADAGGGAALAEAMRGALQPGDRVLLPAAEDGRTELQAALEDAGAEATRVCAYRSVKAELDPELLSSLERDPPALAFFASPRTAEALWDALGAERALALLASAASIAIGPTTRAALDELGAPRPATAARPTPESMVDAAAAALASS